MTTGHLIWFCVLTFQRMSSVKWPTIFRFSKTPRFWTRSFRSNSTRRNRPAKKTRSARPVVPGRETGPSPTRVKLAPFHSLTKCAQIPISSKSKSLTTRTSSSRLSYPPLLARRNRAKETSRTSNRRSRVSSLKLNLMGQAQSDSITVIVLVSFSSSSFE